MIGKLTLKQELFCHEIVKGRSQSEAYRTVFKPKRAKGKTIHEEASRLMADPKVTARIKELMKPIIERAQLTREEWIEDAIKLYRGDVRKLFDQFHNAVPIPELGENEAALIEGFKVVEDFTKVKKQDGSTDAVATGYTSDYKIAGKKARHEYVGKVLGYYKDKVGVEVDALSLEQLVLGSMEVENDLQSVGLSRRPSKG